MILCIHTVYEIKEVENRHGNVVLGLGSWDLKEGVLFLVNIIYRCIMITSEDLASTISVHRRIERDNPELY